MSFTNPQKNKSRGVKSGERGARVTGDTFLAIMNTALCHVPVRTVLQSDGAPLHFSCQGVSWSLDRKRRTHFLVPLFSRLDMKFLTSPAPWNRITLSERRVLVIRREAKSPATATDAVPWISSLNVQYFSRYLSSKRNALWFPKSSNWKIKN